MAKHEYILKENGISREFIIYSVYTLSSVMSLALSSAISLALDEISFLQQYSVLSAFLSALSAIFSVSFIYKIISWLFNNYIWKFQFIQKITGVSNLTGLYAVTGESKDGNVTQLWSAEMTIQQSWDKISIFLETSQSSSDSIMAELTCKGDAGYSLIYYYDNNPIVSERELKNHFGVAKLHFRKDLNSAEGDYFNKGKNTSGKMTLHKKQ